MVTSDLRVDGARLNQSLDDLAKIGATAGGGVTRLALSDEDAAGRALLLSWMESAGLAVSIDDLGDMTGHRQGRSAVAPVLLVSHCDTVVRGGRYDGALGVLAGLEVVRTLNEHNVGTERPLALVNLTNEEGVRFEPAMQGSGVLAGRFGRDEIYGRTDRAGVRFIDELRRIGYRGNPASRPLPAAASLELHIEQGPVLEAANRAVGLVEGIVGIAWFEVVIDGQADHAGPSPMHLRRDALAAAARVISGVERLALACDETAVATVGRLRIEPNVINTIPGRAVFSVDLRHPDAAVLERRAALLHDLVDEVCAATGVTGSVRRFWTSEPTPFDRSVLAAIESSMRDLDLPVRRLWSGAGHDSKYLAGICPSGMIFVRSQGGLSHCEQEFSTPADVTAGANVLLGATLRLAGMSPSSV